MTAGSEEASGVPGADRLKRRSRRSDQGLAGAGLPPAQYALGLRKGLLDGVSMRRHILSRATVVASGDLCARLPGGFRKRDPLKRPQIRCAVCADPVELLERLEDEEAFLRAELVE